MERLIEELVVLFVRTQPITYNNYSLKMSKNSLETQQTY